MKKNKQSRIIRYVGIGILIAVASIPLLRQIESSQWKKPLDEMRREFNFRDGKNAIWTEEDAQRHSTNLEKFMPAPSANRFSGSYANGALIGTWKNRGAANMPGAFKFVEHLDGTDTIYAVTWNHYSGEYNAKSTIWKGTIYNPKTGTKGEDFVNITPYWPNSFKDLIAFKNGGKTRLLAGIDNGELFWSDNDGGTWTKATGLPSLIHSTAINRQDGNRIYATNGRYVYLSTNGGTSFTQFQDFGTDANGAMYSPRYTVQPGNENVYFARSGQFYTLAKGASSFTKNINYLNATHGRKEFSIGGDSRQLYVSENGRFWVSSNGGSSWTEKFPKGNWYGEKTGKMSAGVFLAVNPSNPDQVIGGYAQPVFSLDGLNTTISTTSGWGGYQNGSEQTVAQYRDRIRFNYHPDFQSSHFFYNASGDLFSASATDGGVFVSYGVWKSPPAEGTAYSVNGYSSHWINVTLGVDNNLIYRTNLFTGYKDPNHIAYSTQDQGTQQSRPESTGDGQLDYWQIVGGDGSPHKTSDGNNVWRWQREGKTVWGPTKLYDANGARRKFNSVNGDFDTRPKVDFSGSTNIGWVQAYVDRHAPATRIWLLSTRLDRATNTGTSLVAHSVTKGTNQVAAIAQGQVDGKKIWFVQDGKVFTSTNNGDTFDNGVVTPFTKTPNEYGTGDLGGGWVLPGNDNWILFAGPSSNNVGAILSKDGGANWTNVTGSLPYGDDFQVSGMIGSPDGKFVFAGTDLGPWVFVVAEEKWYPIGEGAGYFNTTDIEFVSTNTVRFATWGVGVWDFTYVPGNSEPFLTANSPTAGSLFVQSSDVEIKWSTNSSKTFKIDLLKNGVVVSNVITGKSGSSHLWKIPSTLAPAGDYSLRISEEGGTLTSTTGKFTVVEKMYTIDQKTLSIFSFSSEEPTGEGTGNGKAIYMLDGNVATYWHTQWQAKVALFPHEVVIDLAKQYGVTGIEYTPRAGAENGRIENYEIYLSNSATSWGSVVASGKFVAGEQAQKVLFKVAGARYLKFVAKSALNGANFAGAAELNVFNDPNYIPVFISGNVDQLNNSFSVKRVRGATVQLSIPTTGTYRVELYNLLGRQLYSEHHSLETGVAGISFAHLGISSQTLILRVTGGGRMLKLPINLL